MIIRSEDGEEKFSGLPNFDFGGNRYYILYAAAHVVFVGGITAYSTQLNQAIFKKKLIESPA